MKEPLRADAPGKLNLALAVVGERDDGYHELVSLFLRIGLADSLRVEPLPGTAERDVLSVEGDPDCPTDANLVLDAATLLRERAGRTVSPVAIQLTKRVPVAAGLGGGSSDAASALAILTAVWAIALTPEQRHEVALALGSDVPFFTASAAAALVAGRGEQVKPLAGVRGVPGILLVVPPERLRTADVFAAWDRLHPPDGHARRVAESLAARIASGLGAAELSEAAGDLAAANDLWPAAVALSPALVEVRDAAESALVRRLLLSGSGPTLAALYPSPDAAVEAARELEGRRPAALAGATIIVTDTRTPTPLWRTA